MSPFGKPRCGLALQLLSSDCGDQCEAFFSLNPEDGKDKIQKPNIVLFQECWGVT